VALRLKLVVLLKVARLKVERRRWLLFISTERGTWQQYQEKGKEGEGGKREKRRGGGREGESGR